MQRLAALGSSWRPSVSPACRRHPLLPSTSLLAATRSFFVRFRETPNTECYRFEVEGVDFLTSAGAPALPFTRDNSHHSPLAAHVLQALPMVEEVTLGHRFVTVRRVTPAEAAEGAREFVEHFERQHGERIREEERAMREAAASPARETVPSETEQLDEETVAEMISHSSWEELKLHVSALLTDHLYSGAAHVSLDAPHPHIDTMPSDGDSEVILSIKELIRTHIRPLLQEDGGDIRFLSFEAGEMKVELLGACRRCHKSQNTLQDLIERTAQHWIPEVRQVTSAETKRSRTAPKENGSTSGDGKPLDDSLSTTEDEPAEEGGAGAPINISPGAHIVRCQK